MSFSGSLDSKKVDDCIRVLTIPMSMIDLVVVTYSHHTLVLLFFSYIIFRQLKKATNGNPNGLPLPPGPKGYPILGNLFDIPIDKAWLVYNEWRKTYGKSFMSYITNTI